MDSGDKKKFRAAGFHAGLGLMMAIAGVMLAAHLLTLGMNAVGLSADIDDSDLDRWNRSGAKIITDYKTGVQYFRAPGGGITPRLNRNGSLATVPNR